jgi:CMP-N-acetylneuraminic acid synthetase
LTHPYLCVHADGRQIVEHNLYRRQDYPEVYEISHFHCMFEAGDIDSLNHNLYNANTYFYDIPRVVDIDHEKDMEKL